MLPSRGRTGPGPSLTLAQRWRWQPSCLPPVGDQMDTVALVGTDPP